MSQEPNPGWGPPGQAPHPRTETQPEAHQPYSVEARSHYGSLYDQNDPWGDRSVQRQSRAFWTVFIVLFVMVLLFIIGVSVMVFVTVSQF